MRAATNDLGKDSIGSLLFRLALPAILAQVINALYNIVDRMYIGHIPEVGAVALTGVGVTFPILMIIAAFSALIGMGGAPRAAIKMGEKDREGAEHILGNCFILLLGISVVLTAFFLLFQKPLLLAFGASEQTISYALDYLTIYVIGTVFVQLSLGLNPFINTQGFAKTGMLTVFIGAFLNLVLDPLFIYVFQMGVRGAAIATVIAQAVSALWVMWFLLEKKTKLRIRKRYFALKKQVIFPVLALGVSPFVMQGTESVVIVALNFSLQRYGGDLAVGSMAICSSVMQVLLMPLLGLTQGAQPIISYNYGAQNMDRIRTTFRLLFIASLCFSIGAWALVLLFPQAFILVFSSDPQLIDITVWGIRIYTGALCMLGIQYACQQTFVALGEAKVSLFLAFLRKIFLLTPFIFLFPLFFSDQVFAVFLAEPIADILAAATTGFVFLVRFRRILQTIQKKPACE